MKDNKSDNSKPTPENIKKADAGYNPTDRDFQRTEKDIDSISASEKDELTKDKEKKSK